MSIGSAVFFAAIIFALIYLYQITHDRWNWRKVTRWTLTATGATVSLIILGVMCIFAYQKIEKLPRRQTEYAGLRLGMTKDEVRYINGYPQAVVADISEVNHPNLFSITATRNLKDNQRIEDFSQWEYKFYNGSRIDITFAPETMLLNEIVCFSEGALQNVFDGKKCPEILGIVDGTKGSETDVISRLGQPTNSSIIGMTKKIEYDNLGVWFYLKKQYVYMIGIKSTQLDLASLK